MRTIERGLADTDGHPGALRRSRRAASSATLIATVAALAAPLSAGTGTTGSPATTAPAPSSTTAAATIAIPTLGWQPSTTKFDGQTIDQALAEKLAGGSVSAWANCSVWENADGTLSATSTGTKHPCVAVIQQGSSTTTELFVSQVACPPRDADCLGGYVVDTKVESKRLGTPDDGWTKTFETTYKGRGRRVKTAIAPLRLAMKDTLSIKLAHGTVSSARLDRYDASGAAVGSATTGLASTAADQPNGEGDCTVRATAAGRQAAELWEAMARDADVTFAAYAGLAAKDPAVGAALMSAALGQRETAERNAQVEEHRAFEASYQQCMTEVLAKGIDPNLPTDKAPATADDASSSCASGSSTITMDTSYTDSDGTQWSCQTTVQVDCGTLSDGTCGCAASEQGEQVCTN